MPEKKPKQNIIDDPNREYVVGLIKAIGGVEKTLSNLENSPTVAIMKALQEKLENGNDVASFMWSLLRGPRGEKGDSIKGDPGPQGIPGKQGIPGEPGKSLDEGEILRKLLKSIPEPIPGPQGLPGEKGKDAVVDYAKIIDAVIEKLPKNKGAKKELLKISVKDIEDFPEIGELVRKYVYDFSESRASNTIVAPGGSHLRGLLDVSDKDIAVGFVPTWNGTQFVFQAPGSLGYTAENVANKGIADGYASLDGAGKVPASQLPSYVDDVLEYATLASFPATGTTGVIYVDIATSKTYRWTGSVYAEISPNTMGGSDTHVQFNDGGAPGGTSNFVYDKTSGFLRIGGAFANETGALRINGAVYASGGFGIPGLTQLTLSQLYSAVTFTFKGYNGTAQTDIMKFENQGTTNLSANFLTRVGVNIALPGGIFHSRTSSVTIPGTSNTYPILADGGASSGLMGIGADNTYGYLQSFNAKPLWINNAGNNVYIASSGNRIGVGLSTTTLPTKYVFGNKPADDNTYAYDTDTMVITHQTATGSATLNDPKQVLILGRQGAPGVAYSAGAVFSISRYENSSVNSRTRLDISLAHNSFDLTSNIAATFLSNGNVGFGTTAPVSKVHAYQNNTEIGAGGGFTIEQAGTGDALMQYVLTGTRRWVTGIDNSDNDAFKFSASADLANALWSMSTSGLLMGTFTGQQISFQSGGFSAYHTNGDTYWRAGFTGKYLQLRNSVNTVVQWTAPDSGSMSIGKTTAPTALLEIGAGTATANTAPLKFTAGTALTTPEAGTFEFSNSETGLTFTAVATRRQVVLDTATQTLSGKTIVEDSNTLKLKKVVGVQVFDSASDVATGDGKAFFRIPASLNGANLVSVAMNVYTAGTTGTMDVQIRNVTDSQDMLSTKLTIDSTETDTSTAVTPAVINTTYDDVATGDKIAIDVDAVQTTKAKGLYVELTFQLP